MEAAYNVKAEGGGNDLLERIMNSGKFNLSQEEMDEILDISKFVGRSPELTEEFIKEEVFPMLDAVEDEWQTLDAGEVKV